MCLNRRIIPCFRTGDPTYVSMESTTELVKDMDVQMKIHIAVQHQDNIPSVIYLINGNHKLYCFISNIFSINTIGIYYNVSSCIYYTEAGNVINLVCNCMTNSCIPHYQYMKGHDTYDSYCYTDNDSSRVTNLTCHGHRSYIRINPFIPHHIYMRDHDTYDDICGGE